MAKLVRDTRDERVLRAHDDEVEPERRGEIDERLRVGGAHRMALAERCEPRIPRSGVQLGEERRLRDLPGERMLASA